MEAERCPTIATFRAPDITNKSNLLHRGADGRHGGTRRQERVAGFDQIDD